MTDSLLRRYTATDASGADRRPDAADAADDLGGFGWLRGVKERPVMLELRKKNGGIKAIPYAWLESAEFDPSDGITLTVAGTTIRIRGRHLNAEARPMVRLFEGIVRQRVPWIQEATGPELMTADADSTLIERIEW